MKRLLMIVPFLFMTACASLGDMVPNRQDLYGPAPLNAARATSTSVSAYRSAETAARAAYADGLSKIPPAQSVVVLVDAGIAAANSNCRAWFSKVSDAELRFAQGQGNLGVIENAITAILGAAKASYGVITGYGIAATALEGYNQNFHSSVLGIADYDLQTKLTEIMATRARELRAAAQTMTYPQAIDAIDAYVSLCTPQAARATVKSSLGATTTTVTPSGALRSIGRPSP